MKIIKILIVLWAVLSIAGVALFQLFLLIFNTRNIKPPFVQHIPRQGGFTQP